MTADPPTAKYLTTGQAAAWLLDRGIQVSRQTIRNWMTVGCIRGGKRVYLQHMKVGRLITRKRWLREFLESSQRVPTAPSSNAGPAESPDAQADRFRREKEQAQDHLRRRPRKAKARTP